MNNSTEQNHDLPVQDKNPTRTKIMEAALEEFNRLGFTGARVDTIAEKAGVNKAMIYYHFSSKENLYHEIIEHTVGRLARRISDDIEKAESLEDILLGIAQNYSDIYMSTNNLLPLLVRELANPKSQFLDQLANLLRTTGLPEKIHERIGAKIRQGEIREIDFRQALASFVTMNIGYYIMSPIINRVLNIDDPEEFIAKRSEAVVDIFLNGIKVR